MWDFGWHLRGSVHLTTADHNNAAALARIAALLKKQNKKVSRRGSDFVEFNDPFWGSFGPNWLAMVMYDRGRFWIEQNHDGDRLRYDLRSLHGMVFCLIAALLFFLVGFGSGGLLEGIKFAAGVFAWLYGMNLFLALIRVPPAIRQSVRDYYGTTAPHPLLPLHGDPAEPSAVGLLSGPIADVDLPTSATHVHGKGELHDRLSDDACSG